MNHAPTYPEGYCPLEKATKTFLTARQITLEDGSLGVKGFCASCQNVMVARGQLPKGFGEVTFPIGLSVLLSDKQVKREQSRPKSIKTQAELASAVAAKDWVRVLRAVENDFHKHNEMDWYNKGTALSNLNHPKEALDCFVRAVGLDPLYRKAWYRRGWAHVRLGQFPEATRSFIACVTAENQKATAGLKIDDPWKDAAQFSMLITLILERSPNVRTSLNLMVWIHPVLCAYGLITEETMPFAAIVDGRFADFLVQNKNAILDKLEPKIAPVQVWLGDAGLPSHH